jgi:hypothetical protein
VRDITFSFRDLLVHIPVQLWLLPHESHCSCSFCDECPEPSKMEFHLATRHSRIFLTGRTTRRSTCNWRDCWALTFSFRRGMLGNARLQSAIEISYDTPRSANMYIEITNQRNSSCIQG